MSVWLVLAGISATFTAFVHTFAGQKFVVNPLLRQENFDQVSRYTNYYCWHIVTIVLFSMGVLYFLAASDERFFLFAWLATFYATLFVIWNLIMIAMNGLRLKQFPQWALILPTSILGWIGLFL